MSSRRAHRFLVAAIAVTGLAPACGIPLDETPRHLPAAAAASPTSTSTTALGGGSAFIYLTLEDHVVPVEAEVGDASPAARALALLSARPTARASSQIPAGTTLRSVERTSSFVTVDLSEEFDNLGGIARRLAAAELVFTLTEVGGIEDVLFKVDGHRTRVDSPIVGDTDRVRACDYLSLLPTAEQIRSDQLDPDAARHASARRAALEQRCPSAAGNASREP